MFVNVFQIYSLCNANDVSWGTKEGKLNYMHGRHVVVRICMDKHMLLLLGEQWLL